MDTPVVLVVDDDEDMRSVVRDTLETEGYTVEAAANGIEALERLKTPPRPALILLDLAMPLMDGLTLLGVLESYAELASIRIIVVTAAVVTPETSQLRYPLLRKPFSREALVAAVTTDCPRLWDADEPLTDEMAIVAEVPPGRKTTQREKCIVCGAHAATRCVGCGEAFCRPCLDAGPDGRCTRCWRAGAGLP